LEVKLLDYYDLILVGSITAALLKIKNLLLGIYPNIMAWYTENKL